MSNISTNSRKCNASSRTIKLLNEEVINNNQKKCQFLRKIVNKVVKVSNKEYAIHNLKNCTVRNFKNMKERIQICDFNSSMSSTKSNRSTPKKRASNSTSTTSSFKKQKKCATSSPNTTSTSKSRSSKTEDTLNLSGIKSLYNESEKDSNSEDNDGSRSNLIEDLLNQQKKKLLLTTEKLDSDHSSCSSDSESVVMSDSSVSLTEFNKREIRVKNSLHKIQEIRKLPDYKLIDKLLNEKKKPPHQQSLNTLVVYKRTGVNHWNSYAYLSDQIEQCVLKREWNNLTKLLILLTDAPYSYQPFLLRTTLINIMCNPVVQDDKTVIEKFLKSCYGCQSDGDIGNVLGQLFHIQKKNVEAPKEEESEDDEQNSSPTDASESCSNCASNT